MKVVVSHSLAEPAMDYLRSRVDEVVITKGGGRDELLPELEDADGVIVRIGSITGEMMNRCPRLKVIGRSGVGYDDIDVPAASSLGIPVTITPGGNARAVAEHTFTLILAAAKNLVAMDGATRKGDFSIRTSRTSMELYGKNLFLMGFGYIGKLVAGYAAAFGMTVSVYDPFVPAQSVEDMGYRSVSHIPEGMNRADVVSLHLPLTEETENLFSREYFSLMKKRSILVNCARGGIVDEAALKEALDSEDIYGAGLDVFTIEPPPADLAVLSSRNLTVSPHNASLTEEAVLSVHRMCAESIVSVLNGTRWDKVADASVYDHEKWRTPV